MKILSLIAVIVVLFSLACVNNTNTGDGKGRAVFTITDAAANLESVNSVKMTVQSVKVHSVAQGWIIVSSGARTYDLLELRSQGSQEILADTRLKADTYDQMQLDISSVVVSNATGEYNARLPSNEFAVVAALAVKENLTSTATFDFLLDESLHITNRSEYVMAPVADIETRENAAVQIQNNNRVEIIGGNLTTEIKVGMDVNGNVGVGLRIPANADISIGTGDVIIIINSGSDLRIITPRVINVTT